MKKAEGGKGKQRPEHQSETFLAKPAETTEKKIKKEQDRVCKGITSAFSLQPEYLAGKS
jgi:hypothetical protein